MYAEYLRTDTECIVGVGVGDGVDGGVSVGAGRIAVHDAREAPR